MCNCNAEPVAVPSVFKITEDITGLVELDTHSTAVRRVRTPSGRIYIVGGNYLTVYAFPEDVAHLTQIQINGTNILTEA